MQKNFKQKSIWIIEDNDQDINGYRDALDLHYHTHFFQSICEYESELVAEEQKKPDLVLVDLILPDGDFLSYLSENSKKFDHPFIVVSMVQDLDALRFCFQEGASDYILKPLKKGEILAKVEKAIEQQLPKVNESRLSYEVQVGDLVVGGLTAKQHKMLLHFLENDQQVATREGLLSSVWSDCSVHPKTLDVHLYNLRRKLHAYGLMIRSHGNGEWILMSSRIK